MSDLPSPEINPPQTPTPAAPDPAPFPEISPATTPDEAPAIAPTPDDGRPYD